jgi:hypothetical protein
MNLKIFAIVVKRFDIAIYHCMMMPIWFEIFSITPSSIQGKPVAMQAGASKQGIALATKYADAVYSVSWCMTYISD